MARPFVCREDLCFTRSAGDGNILQLLAGARVLEVTLITPMKTLLSTLSILALTLTAMWLDTSRLDAAAWFMALAVAGCFGLALHDGSRRPARLHGRLA